MMHEVLKGIAIVVAEAVMIPALVLWIILMVRIADRLATRWGL